MKPIQWAFSKMCRHLIRQGGKRAVSGRGGACRYRAPGGLRCPVGALIHNRYYDKSLEGCSVHNTQIVLALKSSGVPTTPKDIGIYSEVQSLHDGDSHLSNGTRLRNWATGLRRIANAHNLKFPTIRKPAESKAKKTPKSKKGATKKAKVRRK